MAEIKNSEIGDFGLIQMTERGITQIGLTEEQRTMFEFLVSTIGTKENPLVRLPKEYDFEIASNKTTINGK